MAVHPYVCTTSKLTITYIFTAWCRFLLEKLNGLQLVKKFPEFYETRRLITALTSVRHLSLPWASSIQATYLHPTSCRSMLIATHLTLRLPICPFAPVSRPKPYTNPLFTHTRHMSSQSHSSRIYHAHNIGWDLQIIYLLVMQSPSFPRFLVTPRSKYSPEHHIFQHTQLPFLPQYQRTSFTPIQNNRQNYISVYLNKQTNHKITHYAQHKPVTMLYHTVCYKDTQCWCSQLLMCLPDWSEITKK